MKYGQQLEQESVPQWSLHNLDYNSLKHEIRVHTTRDQAARAMTIPGQQDTALLKFENGLYLELCHQHQRVELFVTSKADEVSRRLDHLSRNIERWLDKRIRDPTGHLALKQYRRFAKYERDLFRCGDDIRDLERFSQAQVVAFRKILKKYKKWTSSTTLGSRFNENVLSDPKSFTKRDFSPLQQRYGEVLAHLQEAQPHLSDATATSSDDQQSLDGHLSPRSSRHPSSHQVQPIPEEPQVKYWNEYDDGSEAGGPEDDYAIYINPDEESGFPGIGYVRAILTLPFQNARQWFGGPKPTVLEQDPLLSGDAERRGYESTTVVSDTEEEGYASSDGYPTHGFSAHYAFPSISDQKVVRYREKVLFWGTIGCYAASFALLAIASVLITTGRHRLRVEVDAAVTVAVVLGMFCACSALGMSLSRTDRVSVLYRVMMWSMFLTACILNAMLLVLVVGNAP